MKSGHSVWTKYRQGNEAIDLHRLFSSYWSSNNHEFTVMSQSSPPISPHIPSDRWTESVVIGKHSGYLEVQLSANDAVHTFPLPILTSY